jgi:hypothetical protein
LRVENLSFDAQGIANYWQDTGFSLPQPIQAIFQYTKTISITNSHIQHLPNFAQLNIQEILVRGNRQEREMIGHGAFENEDAEDVGQWQIESFMPEQFGQQTGKFTAKSAIQDIELIWSGAWLKKNMQLTLQLNNHDESSLLASIHQNKQHWEGNIHSQAWSLQTADIDSIITGNLTFKGTTKHWQINSEKLLWEETTLKTQGIFIQTMTSYDVMLNAPTQTMTSSRIDIEDANMDIAPKQALLHTSWSFDLPSINIQNLYASFGSDKQNISSPALNGTASVKQKALSFDMSAQVDEHQFWRVHSQNNGTFYLSMTHVPLIQLRSLLPNPIRDESETIQGLATLKLVVNPNASWKTTGSAYVSDLVLASKNQSFSTRKLELNVLNADINGMTQATLRADGWAMQFPLTPRQAWSNPSHLSSWVKIPWSFNDVTFTHGQVLIGNKNSVWLDHAYLHVLNWQKDKPADLKLLANFGLTPITAKMRLQKQERLMTWQKLSIQFQHANIFVLNDWLKISDLPQVQQGHCSLDISASRSEEKISGSINLKLHHLHMISEQQPANYLKQVLDNPLLEAPMKLMHIHTDFNGDDNWSALAANALISAVSRKNNTNIEKYSSQQTTYKHLGSLRIQQDIRLSLNERTRLRKIIKTLRHRKNIYIELTPDLGTAELTPKLKQQVIATQAVIQRFMQQRGIKRDYIYAALPQAKHHSTSDVGAVHINLVQ